MTKFAARNIDVDFNGTPVGQLTAFSKVGSTRDLIDASAYGDDWKDFVLGQQDGTEITGTVAYDPSESGHTALRTAYDSDPDGIQTFTLTHTEAGAAFDISCRLTALSTGGDVGGLFEMEFGAKIVNPGVVAAS